MNNVIDTKDLITFGEEFPKILINNTAYEVNDLKETADKIDEVLKSTDENIDKDREVLVLALGEKAVEEIEALKLKTKGYTNLVKLVMATIQGITFEEFNKNIEKN